MASNEDNFRTLQQQSMAQQQQQSRQAVTEPSTTSSDSQHQAASLPHLSAVLPSISSATASNSSYGYQQPLLPVSAPSGTSSNGQLPFPQQSAVAFGSTAQQSSFTSHPASSFPPSAQQSSFRSLPGSSFPQQPAVSFAPLSAKLVDSAMLEVAAQMELHHTNASTSSTTVSSLSNNHTSIGGAPSSVNFVNAPSLPSASATNPINSILEPAPAITQPTILDTGERIIEISPNGRYAKMNILLGKGAHKVVYKAIDREEGYEVAWNCFQTTKAEYNELSPEIEILKRVRHPNIINFHDCWFNNGEFVFVTELMTSGTLREYIRKLQIPNVKIVKRWCRQILKGLLYLHSHNPPIIHRDIKCDNIFINGAHGEVKIGDMGTAEMKMGKKYTVIGTPEFMAPEMYEEKGYNEKVDVYAFGMCLLEMVTGEYPYNECTNAAQIYRKVIQGLKPDGLSKVTDPEIYDLITKCLAEESQRLTVQQGLEHPFLSVEPEVVLLFANETKTHLTLQVVFKGLDKLSAKFEFNTETDTAEEVVHEMIEENVLPLKYQTLITHEINRILREMNKLTESDKNKEEDKSTWRRSEHVKDELERAKRDLQAITERALEAEKKAELLEVRARLAEEKNMKTVDIGNATVAHGSPMEPQVPPETSKQPPDRPEEIATPLKEYRDDQDIADLVRDVAMANNRGQDKANEWLSRLHSQDVMTVGDLRDLHDADWASLGLTVFASRALRNALHGKTVRNVSPKNASRSVVTTPPTTGLPQSTSEAESLSNASSSFTSKPLAAASSMPVFSSVMATAPFPPPPHTATLPAAPSPHLPNQPLPTMPYPSTVPSNLSSSFNPNHPQSFTSSNTFVHTPLGRHPVFNQDSASSTHKPAAAMGLAIDDPSTIPAELPSSSNAAPILPPSASNPSSEPMTGVVRHNNNGTPLSDTGQ